MTLERYIRAYIPQVGSLAFEIKLPKNNTLTALQTLKLGDEDDPLFIFQYDLNYQQVKLLCLELGCAIEDLDDRFDYQLECDRVVVTKVKTKEELIKQYKGLRVFISQILDDNDFSEGSVASLHLEQLNDFAYTIYQQGVQDGRL